MKNIFSSLACLMLCSLSALGHGSMADPISRSYEVFLENPESPTSAAGRAAVAVAGTQAFYDWDEVNLRVPNYDYQALIPNGMLASAGRAKYAGIDLPRTDWPATAMVAGPRVCRFHLHTPHDPSFFKAYITKEGYDPTQPLKWSDLVLIPGGETATLNGFDYFMTLQFPERVGRHVLYVIWQRIDPANEAFFSTSDLDFGGVDYGAPPPPPVISATVAFSHTNAWTGGGQAAFRITNQTNQNIESWTLEFDWAADISSVWSGVIKSKVGTHYVVTNADYNARILPGAFIDVGCVASFSTPGLLPTDLGCVGIGGGGGGTISAPVITSATSANVSVGNLFSYQITASGTPTSFGATSLPAGLAVNTSTGLISGTPTTAAVSNISITATNSAGTATAVLALTVTQSSQCIGDLNRDGTVDSSDMGDLLGSIGLVSTNDLNSDGVTDSADIGVLLGVWGPCETPAPTDGFTQVPFTHYIQFPWDLQLSDRYSLTNGIHDFKVYNTDQPFESGSTTTPRTEMRINNNYTSGVWQFEGDLFVPTGTTGVAVMQVFGGSTSSTSCQLRVYNGSLCYYTTPIMNNILDTWIHVNVIHDANAHTVSIYLNGTFVRSAPDRGPANYYFKCGVYQQENSSVLMQSKWTNIKVWSGPA